MEFEKTYQLCVEGLRKFARGTGFSDAVIGLSGGIDSALTALISVEAFGAEHVHGVLMPGPHSSDHSITDAQELADNLNLATITLPIKEPYEAFARVLAEACGGSLSGLAAENTQARCRMIHLMALSNRYNWMVVNTGNKSEAMMGYSTLYGDTAGAYAPIGGLYKTQVYEMARWCNEQSARIPHNTIEKPASAELSPGQEDEKSLGLTYETIDRILINHFDHAKSIEALIAEGESPEDIEKVLTNVKQSAFKRAQEPPFPEV